MTLKPSLKRLFTAQTLGYALFFAGFTAVLAGCWHVSHALALIVGGVVLCVLGFLAGLDRRQDWDR